MDIDRGIIQRDAQAVLAQELERTRRELKAAQECTAFFVERTVRAESAVRRNHFVMGFWVPLVALVAAALGYVLADRPAAVEIAPAGVVELLNAAERCVDTLDLCRRTLRDAIDLSVAP